jgi:Kdo2-lipid IVA lauroyltransferase/acyltransferase
MTEYPQLSANSNQPNSTSRLDRDPSLVEPSRRSGRPTSRRAKDLPRPLRHRLEYLAFRAAQTTARALPLEVVSSASGLAWRMIAPRLRRQERALRNLRLAFPELSEAERKRIAADMWESLGRTFGESFHLEEIAAQKRIRFESSERLEEMIRTGPSVMCGLHLGNWELVAYTSKFMGAPFTGVYQRLSNPVVDEETRKIRAFLYEGGLLPKTPVSARALMKTAKSGGYPAFLADLRDDNGAAVPFFGAPALATVFPALLARKAGLPLYAGAAFREPNVRFVIRVEPVAIPRTDDHAADAIEGTKALHAQFEAFIRQAPEQWMWAHRKWG